MGSSSSITVGAAASWIASTRPSRCPSDRSRGCIAGSTSPTRRSSSAAVVPASTAASRSPCAHSSRHRREVEQVAGRLRHQPDQPARVGRRQRPTGRARRRRRSRRRAAPSPAAPTAATTCPTRCGPSSATTSPARRSTSTPRTAYTPGYRTTTPRAAERHRRPSCVDTAARRFVVRRELAAQRLGEAARVAHRQRQRLPPAQLAERDNRRRQRRRREHVARRADRRRPRRRRDG